MQYHDWLYGFYGGVQEMGGMKEVYHQIILSYGW